MTDSLNNPITPGCYLSRPSERGERAVRVRNSSDRGYVQLDRWIVMASGGQWLRLNQEQLSAQGWVVTEGPK